MRTGRREPLGLLEVGAEFVELLLAEREPHAGPDPGFLEVNVRAADGDELPYQRLEPGVAGTVLLQLVKQLLSVLLLTDRLVREPFAAPVIDIPSRPSDALTSFSRLLPASSARSGETAARRN